MDIVGESSFWQGKRQVPRPRAARMAGWSPQTIRTEEPRLEVNWVTGVGKGQLCWALFLGHYNAFNFYSKVKWEPLGVGSRRVTVLISF